MRAPHACPYTAASSEYSSKRFDSEVHVDAVQTAHPPQAHIFFVIDVCTRFASFERPKLKSLWVAVTSTVRFSEALPGPTSRRLQVTNRELIDVRRIYDTDLVFFKDGGRSILATGSNANTRRLLMCTQHCRVQQQMLGKPH